MILDFPTIESLGHHLLKEMSLDGGEAHERELRQENFTASNREPIAIVGKSLRI